MKPENIIIAMAFLLVISAFSFNFEKITGFQVSDALLKVPQAGIVNDVIKAGQPIQLRVKINDYCVDPKVEFYKNNIRKSHTTYRPTEDECQGQNFYPCRGSTLKFHLEFLNKFLYYSITNNSYNYPYQVC